MSSHAVAPLNSSQRPTFHRAFVESLTQPRQRHTPGWDWETYDDLEEDLRVFQGQVMDLVEADFDSDIVNDTEILFEQVAFAISSDSLHEEQGASIILNHLRHVIEHEMFGVTLGEREADFFMRECRDVLNNMNRCESNIWHKVSTTRRDTAVMTEDHRFNIYLDENDAYFRSLPSWRQAFLRNFIEWNKEKIAEGYVVARQAMQNIEQYVDNFCTSPNVNSNT